MSSQMMPLSWSSSQAVPVLPIRPLQAGFPDVESAMNYLLSHAKNLVEDKIYPKLPMEPYVDSMVPVLSFIHKHAARFVDANIGPEICLAIEHIALDIHMLPHVPLHVVPKEEPTDQQLLSTGAILLTAYQDSIRRVARGARALDVRVAFGLHEPFDIRSVTQVVHAIERFLHGAHGYPKYVKEAGLSLAQMSGLLSIKRVLWGWIQKNQPEGCPGFLTLRRARILHAAIEYFFDRYAAAVSAKFLDMPEERIRGLSFLPRNLSNRGQREPKEKHQK